MIIFVDWLWCRVLLTFDANLAPIWLPKGSQNRAKLVQEFMKTCTKTLTIYLLDFWSVWEHFFVNLASKLEGRGTNKYWTNTTFLAFLLFRSSRQPDAIWSIFWSTWPATWHPKPTKNPPKSLPKSIKKQSKTMSNIWSVFLSIFIDLGRLWGSKLDPCWGHVGHKSLKKKTLKTRQQKLPYNRGRGRMGERSRVSLILQKTTFNTGIQRPHS